MKTGTWADIGAATIGPDGTPNTFDRHPGCDPGGQPLRLIKGGRA